MNGFSLPKSFRRDISQQDWSMIFELQKLENDLLKKFAKNP